VRRKADGYVCTVPGFARSIADRLQILCRKEISYSKMSQKEKEQLQAELSILKELRHPNIVAYFERDHIKLSQDLHLYMEYCGNGDLGRVIRNLKDAKKLADEEFVWSIMSQITGALYRCHYGEDPPPAGQNVLGLGQNVKPGQGSGKPKILHRDLKPENSEYYIKHPSSSLIPQSSSARTTPSNLATSASPRSCNRTTSPRPTSAPPSTCRLRYVKLSNTHIFPISGR
jgi:serine/threonine protein kinase